MDKIIGEINYIKLETYNRLLIKMSRLAMLGNPDYLDFSSFYQIQELFQDFGLDLMDVIKERDSFSEQERLVILGSFWNSKIPSFVLTGVYLDQFQDIFIEANIILKDYYSESGDLRKPLKDSSIEEVYPWDDALLPCYYGLERLLN